METAENTTNELILRIEEKYAKMSKGQRRLADYVCKNYDKAVFLTAAKLGETVGVSESTVVRFAIQLGYKGYPGFQKALEELVRKSELVKLEQCNALVMDTGVLEEKRFLLPILYTVSGLAMQKSDLQDPDYTFSTLDELFSGAEPGLCQAADTRVVTFFPHLFGSLADYDTGELLVTQNQVLDMMKSISQAQESAQTPEETQVTAVTAGNVGSAFFDQTAALDCAYFPIPNREGGVTGTVRVFGAINANTTHVGEAFSILELLLSDDVQGGTGLKAKGKTYCNLFPFGNFLNRSMPVKDGLTEKLFGLSQEQADAAQEMAEKITVVRLPSTLDVMLYSLYWDYPKNAPVEMVEEWEKQLPMVISSMEMALAE